MCNIVTMVSNTIIITEICWKQNLSILILPSKKKEVNM